MKSAIIVARHGERIDYYLRDNGGNWLQEPNNERPWDPPLTYRGQMQARRLGSYLYKLIQELELPPLEAVYSSLLTRCCMTAGEAIIGYQQKDQEADKNKKECTSSDLKVHIETGLVEVLNEKWYRSWCLQDSDGTWGGKDGDKYQNGVFPPPIHESDVHSKGKIRSHLLFQSKTETCEYLQNYRGHGNDESLDSFNGSTHVQEFQSSSGIVSQLLASQEKEIYSSTDNSYQWNNFESRKVLQDRVTDVANELSRKHPGKTILLVSHGSPVTRLYESLSGNDWKAHGVSTYTSFSIYQSKDSEEGNGWQVLRANDNTHVEEIHMESADQKAAW
ncbi:hypothetical protein CTEN210_06567 [Chaetoceros tenuissimus]|uniref:Phosphoglycerate mutase n=1 Tax=Chaetoceros tenuissimus TaxID=426638 RepID=A0AAD3CRX7_9STRA|nr:hypothetical protein CTEN210_06567 [Chaetoceros tenuissimus]